LLFYISVKRLANSATPARAERATGLHQSTTNEVDRSPGYAGNHTIQLQRNGVGVKIESSSEEELITVVVTCEKGDEEGPDFWEITWVHHPDYLEDAVPEYLVDHCFRAEEANLLFNDAMEAMI
jgi:hypothetical protein